MNILLIILALICFILTLILSKKDRVNFLSGILLSISIILLILSIYMTCTDFKIIDGIIFLTKYIMPFITYIISILLIYNGIYNSINLLKTRKNNITDLLSILSGMALIMISILISKKSGVIYTVTNIIIFYINIMFISYALNSIIYSVRTKITNYDIIIVLGAGLINGIKPSRTLQNRLNKAIEVYNSNDIKPYIIVSGGKGADEKISEAEAMKKYLLEKGIEENKIILEDKSTNTYENLKFSKEKLNELGDSKRKIAMISSDFHIYRAALFAKKLNIEIDGIGAKTLYYYFPNAFIREFAAILVMFIKRK